MSSAASLDEAAAVTPRSHDQRRGSSDPGAAPCWPGPSARFRETPDAVREHQREIQHDPNREHAAPV